MNGTFRDGLRPDIFRYGLHFLVKAIECKPFFLS